MVLVVILIVVGFLAVRTLGFGAFAPKSAVPTASLIPGSNQFYVVGSPPWGSVSVDGHIQTHIPDAGIGNPLRFAPGTHLVVWSAPPFLPQRCTVVVPAQNTRQSCTGDNNTIEPGPNGWTITFSASLATLSDRQRTALIHATQSLLDSFESTETVQPGEHFVDVHAPQMIATATQPLKATLHFQLDTNPNSTQPCTAIHLKRCEANLDCHLFCDPIYDVPLSEAGVKGWMCMGS